MKVLYIASRNPFPYGSAYASRVMNFARLLSYMGTEVHVIADFSNEPDYIPGSIQRFEEFTYQALGKHNNQKSRRKYPRECLSAVKEYLADNRVDAVIYNSNSARFWKIRRYCKSNSRSHIVESCEWRDPSNFRFGRCNPQYVLAAIGIRFLFRKADGIIAISRLLEDYYKRFVANTVRIPTILDVINTPCVLEPSGETIKIMYAGSLGKSKELLRDVLVAIRTLKEKRKHIEFHIYGAKREQVLANIGNDEALLDALSDCVFIEERVPQQQMNEVYGRHDFSIFIRPDRRSSHAGFPTKLAESMAAGTPVIANDTGDIGLYLADGYNGYLLRVASCNNIAEMFERILEMSAEERKKLRKNARKTAEGSFDYRGYGAAMKRMFLVPEDGERGIAGEGE